MAQPRPVDRGQAHRARFATGVEIAIVQLERFQPLAGRADSDDLSVGRRVVGRGDLIRASPNDFALPHDHCTEGTALAAAHHLNGETNGLPHELAVHTKSSPTFIERGTCLPPSNTFVTWPLLHLRRR